MNGKTIFRNFVLIFVLLVGVYGQVVVNKAIWAKTDAKGEDVYYAFIEGLRINKGENPYSRIHSGNMLENQKYPTYFPLFYLLAAAVSKAGLNEFSQWLAFWRIIFLIFNILTGALLFYIFYKDKKYALAVFAYLLWLFNRWTLIICNVSHIEFLPIFFLVLSVYLFDKKRTVSLLLFGLSLSIKQIGIFLFPVYLIWVWNNSENKKIKPMLISVLLIAAVPLIVSAPFLFSDATGFTKSILFSFTRYSGDHFSARTFFDYLGVLGILTRLPLLIILFFVFYFIYKKNIQKYVSSMMVFIVFIFFNPILFIQYMVWIIPFLLLMLTELPGYSSDGNDDENEEEVVNG